MSAQGKSKEPYMKRIIAAAILLIGANFGLASHASAQESAIEVTVPFDFAVGSHVLPSGTYRISNQGWFLDFHRNDTKVNLLTSGLPGHVTGDGRSKLTFDAVSGHYFLRKIETTSSTTSADFPKSTLEKKSQELAQSRSIYTETSSR